MFGRAWGIILLCALIVLMWILGLALLGLHHLRLDSGLAALVAPGRWLPFAASQMAKVQGADAGAYRVLLHALAVIVGYLPLLGLPLMLAYMRFGQPYIEEGKLSASAAQIKKVATPVKLALFAAFTVFAYGSLMLDSPVTPQLLYRHPSGAVGLDNWAYLKVLLHGSGVACMAGILIGLLHARRIVHQRGL